eukprot:TRINITY_DN1284_c0_g1_i2.p1 TRINITY_DN1284_c0_g1~~TRINITY_DN1284_c0_g1_i2.p1  ORF type:complete len:279 (-),score=44.23 TRINITY_DN1284_c0_g1_i2:555-1391(-)
MNHIGYIRYVPATKCVFFRHVCRASFMRVLNDDDDHESGAIGIIPPFQDSPIAQQNRLEVDNEIHPTIIAGADGSIVCNQAMALLVEAPSIRALERRMRAEGIAHTALYMSSSDYEIWMQNYVLLDPDRDVTCFDRVMTQRSMKGNWFRTHLLVDFQFQHGAFVRRRHRVIVLDAPHYRPAYSLPQRLPGAERASDSLTSNSTSELALSFVPPTGMLQLMQGDVPSLDAEFDSLYCPLLDRAQLDPNSSVETELQMTVPQQELVRLEDLLWSPAPTDT